MFAKSKVSQSMIDAVNKVLGEQPVEQKDELLNETAPIKEPTPTGMRVYGGSYGNSAKAKKDQTKSAVDDLKGPKDKEMKEAAKPDYLDFDKDGNKKESMKKALADKAMKEELKGNQDKIDANHNGEIDAQDFKILRAKKKVKEGREFTEKLLEMVRKSDVPAYLRKAKGDTPLTMADVKAPKKDSISAPENLAKARNEEVEQIEERDEGKPGLMFKKIAAKAAKEYGSKEAGNRVAGAIRKKVLAKEEIQSLDEEQLDEIINEVLSKNASAGDWIHDFVHSDNPKFAGKSKAERKKMALGAYYGAQKEAYDVNSDDAITTDTLAGRVSGGKSNSFQSFKSRVKSLDKEGDGSVKDADCAMPDETSARDSIKAKETNNLDPQKVKNQDAKYGRPTPQDHVKEATIAGTPGWKKMSSDVITDKSGAKHTPMSRARDLARQALKKVQDKTKIGESKKKW
jgi:hypothetical protein